MLKIKKINRVFSHSVTFYCYVFISLFSLNVLAQTESYLSSNEQINSFRMESLLNEDGVIPDDAYFKAWNQIKNLRPPANSCVWGASLTSDEKSECGLDSKAGITTSSWVSLGPEGLGGRIRSCIINPENSNEIIIGTSGGGIWKSEDSGASWNCVDDFMNNLAISCMVRNPADSNVIYAGTGDSFSTNHILRGAGVFKSTDNGATWSQLTSTVSPDWYFVNRLAISPDGKVILAALNKGIYRSTDEGENWTAVFSDGIVNDIEFSTCCTQFAVAGGNEGNIIVSSDNGETWTSSSGLDGGGRVECAVSTTPGIIWASVDLNEGAIYKSSDNGETFQLWGTPAHLGLSGQYANTLWVDSADPNTLFAGGVNLFKLNDAEETWTQVSQKSSFPVSVHIFQHTIVPHADFGTGEGESNIVYCCNDGGIYKADVSLINGDDAGTGWTNINNNLSITALLSASGRISSGLIIAGTDMNGTISYHGDSSHWIKLMGYSGGNTLFSSLDPSLSYSTTPYLGIFRNNYNAVDPSNPATDFINGQYIEDSTLQWKNTPYSIPDSMNKTADFLAPIVIDTNITGQDRILAGGSQLWFTDNPNAENTTSTGPAWRSIKPAGDSVITAVAVADGNSDIVWVGCMNGDIFRTSNATSAVPEWIKLDDGAIPLPGRKITAILLSSTNSERAYITYGGFSGDNIQYTDDNGASWNDITGFGDTALPDVPVYSITSHPDNPDWLYAGTEMGVFASSDAGGEWSASAEGPVNCNVTSLFWMKNDSDIPLLTASTYGRGLYQTEIEYIPPTPSISIEDIAVNEGAQGEVTEAEFKIKLQYAESFPVTVNYATVDGTALISDGDYSAISGTLTFEANETQVIVVDIAGDDNPEENETFSLQLSDPSEGVVTNPSAAVCLIADDDTDSLPSVTISATPDAVDENTQTVTITATLSDVSADDVTLFLVFEGSAESHGIDYNISSDILVIPAGEISASVSITTVPDNIYEQNEDILISVETVVNALNQTSPISVTITDNTPVPEISINDINVSEPDDTVTQGFFSVSLSNASSEVVSVNYATVDDTATADSDYSSTEGTLTFSPGETLKKITVDILGDTEYEGDELFLLQLSDPVGGELSTKTAGECIITENDLPEPAHLSINNLIVREGNSPDYVDAKFEVVLSGAIQFPVSVDYTTVDGAATTADNDYIPASGTLSFVSNGSAFLNVRVYGDDNIEDNENFFVELTTATSNVEPTVCRGECLITDDDDPDLPVITLSCDDDSIAEEGGSAVLTAVLSSAYTKDVTVNMAFAGTAGKGVDFNISSSSIVIPAGNVSGSLTLTAVQDNMDEFDENIEISIDSVINALEETHQSVDITIPDSDQQPSAFINSISVNEGDSGTTSAIFTISLSEPSEKTISIAYQTSDGTATTANNDYFPKNETITFTSGESTKNIEVLIICDETFEDDETFSVNLLNAENADITVGEGVCTIINDDSVEPSSISISDVTVKEGAAGESVQADFEVTLAFTKHFPVTVSYMTINNTAHSENGDYLPAEGNLTFDENGTQTVSITVNGDDLFEKDETFFVNLYNVSPGVEYEKHLGIGTITDDDVEPPSVSLEDIHIEEPDEGETADAVFTLTLTHDYPVEMSVDYTTVDGTAFTPDDYTAATGTVTFPPGATEAKVSIIVNGDFKDESDEVFILKLLNPVNVTIEDSMGVCFIEDDDTSYSLWVNKGTGGGEYVNGETVTITADDPEQGKEFTKWIGSTEFLADPNAMETTLVMPEKNISLTAVYESSEKITLGSILNLDAKEIPDMNLSQFSKKPKLYCMVYDIEKEKNLKLSAQTVTKVSSSMPADSVKTFLKKTSLLYSKDLWKDAQKAGILTVDWLAMNPWQNASLNADVFVKTALPSGDKVDLYVRSALIVVPKITEVLFQNNGSIEGGVSLGAILIVKGNFFGYKPPRVSLEYISSGVVKKQKLKVLKPLKFSDAKGSPGKSCMDLERTDGYSELMIQMPVKWWKGWNAGKYYMVLDNKTGLATYPITTK